MIKILNSSETPCPSDTLISELSPIIEHLNIKGEITINVGTETESKELNSSYRKKEYSTDVLSFPINEDLPDGKYYIGDIFVCNAIAKKQAEIHRISHQEELLQLIIHGILHLTGYDHTKDVGEMLKLQDQLFQKFILKTI